MTETGARSRRFLVLSLVSFYASVGSRETGTEVERAIAGVVRLFGIGGGFPGVRSVFSEIIE